MSQDPLSEPTEPLYGEQTRLSLHNFPPRSRCLGDVPVFVRNYALVKKAAASANRRMGVLDDDRADAIIAACDEITAGRHDSQFPTALVLGGGGTTTNMNVNEVIAARAAQLADVSVHPNDHVNASQSTNDTFPTAMALTIMDHAQESVRALDALSDALREKARESAGIRLLGRTCLQDAVSLGTDQSLHGQAHAIERGTSELRHAVGALCAVPLGATVLGTSIGSPDGFATACVVELAELVEYEVSAAEDYFDALAHLDPYAAVADAACRAATTVARIGSDIRLRSSGPHGGLAELTIPRLQAGSSIMPAKVNPVVPEYAMQLSYRIRGSAATVGYAVAAGELELNVMEPVILDSLLDIFDDLEQAARSMATLCVGGLQWNGPRREHNLAQAVDKWVELAGASGYDEASRHAMTPGD